MSPGGTGNMPECLEVKCQEAVILSEGHVSGDGRRYMPEFVGQHDLEEEVVLVCTAGTRDMGEPVKSYMIINISAVPVSACCFPVMLLFSTQVLK